MIRLGHCADLHITERKNESQATLDEQVETLLWIGKDAKKNGAKIMLCAGDIFDHLSTPKERNAAIHVFQEWANQFSVVCVRGNDTHDRPGDILFFQELRTDKGILTFEQAEIIDDTFLLDTGLTIACIPWPNKALLAYEHTNGDTDNAAKAAMHSILDGAAAKFATSDDPCIILSHMELGTAIMDNDQPLVGKTEVDVSEHALLDTGADYIALGHIHKHQIIKDKICYAGSTRPTKFGCEGDKGYCLVDVEKGKKPVIEHRKAPYRELVTVKFRWNADFNELSSEQDYDIEGKSIRLQYEIPASARTEAQKQIEAIKRNVIEDGAHAVKVDAKITQSEHVRSEDFRHAESMADKLDAYWKSRDDVPARAGKILEKLEILERDVG